MRTSPRRRAREFALQGVYQWLLSGSDPALIRTQLAEATASKEPPETENAPQAEWPGGRRWWQRLLWG